MNSVRCFDAWAATVLEGGPAGVEVREPESMRWLWRPGGLIEQLHDSILEDHGGSRDVLARARALEAVWPFVFVDDPVHPDSGEERHTLIRPHEQFLTDGLLVRLQARTVEYFLLLGLSRQASEHYAGLMLEHLILYDRPVLSAGTSTSRPGR